MPHFNSTMTRKDIVIIGAGSFGLVTAACLRLAGHSVTVVAPARSMSWSRRSRSSAATMMGGDDDMMNLGSEKCAEAG